MDLCTHVEEVVAWQSLTGFSTAISVVQLTETKHADVHGDDCFFQGSAGVPQGGRVNAAVMVLLFPVAGKACWYFF